MAKGGERGILSAHHFICEMKPAQPNAMHVERRDGESVEQLIRRFNKGVVAERITKTFREKMHFVSKSEQRKEKQRRAERNRRKRERITQS